MDQKFFTPFKLHLEAKESVLAKLDTMADEEIFVLTDSKRAARIEHLENLLTAYKTIGIDCMNHYKLLYILLDDYGSNALYEYEQYYMCAKMKQMLKGKSVRHLSSFKEEYPEYHDGGSKSHPEEDTKPIGEIPLPIEFLDKYNEEKDSKNTSTQEGSESGEYDGGSESNDDDESASENDSDDSNKEFNELMKAEADFSAALNNLGQVQKDAVNHLIQQINSKVKKLPEHTNLSKGQKKRAKKAQKKAMMLNQQEQKATEEENRKATEARLAAEAVLYLEKETVSKTIIPVPDPGKTYEEAMAIPNLPVSVKDLTRYVELVNAGTTEVPMGSDDARILKEIADNHTELKNEICKNMNVEAENNRLILAQIRHMQEINDRMTTPEKEEQIAKKYMREKLEQWKAATDKPEAPYYVDMYESLLKEGHPQAHRIITNSISFQDIEGFNFEQTLLLQYQSGQLYKT